MVGSRGEREGQPQDRVARLLVDASAATADALAVMESVMDAAGRTVDFTVSFVNEAAGRLIGDEPAAIVGRTAHELFPDRADWLVALWSAAIRSGEPLIEEIELRPGQPGSPWIRQQIVPLDDAVAITSHDITARKNAERELWHLAHHDPLTGLPNRTLAETRIDRVASRASCVLMFIDVDHFKVVNDRLGHLAGDELLAQVAGRLRSCTRSEDVVARFGGDEFVICVNDPESPDVGQRLAEKIMDTMRYPFQIAGRNVTTTISIGVASGAVGETSSEVIRRADAAVYHSKRSGRDRWTIFDEAMARELHARDVEDQALQQALDTHGIEYETVPFVRLADRSVHSVVLSATWAHPTVGRRRVGDYLAAIPDPDLVARIDAELRRIDVDHVRRVAASLPAGARVRLTLHGDVVDDVSVLELERSLSESGLDPDRWGVDVSSSVLSSSGTTGRAALTVLAATGVGVTLYGTPRSLVTDEDLARLGVRSLQVNPTGETGATTIDPQFAATLSSVTAFASRLGLEAIAANLVDAETAGTLRDLGVGIGQGVGLTAHDWSEQPR